jgi:hypothetical protein
MNKSLRKLASVGSNEILTPPLPSENGDLDAWGRNGEVLLGWLRWKNGFFAFESAFHVFPVGLADGIVDLNTWNRPSTWRNMYGGLANGYLFFAEDIFGDQFCLKQDGVGRFDAETGAVTHLCEGLDSWAELVLREFELYTGYRLAHEWQVRNRPLRTNERLVPKMPFITGGRYVTDNLAAVDSLQGMRFRGELAVQIRDLPDGTPIRYKVI